MIPDLIPGAAIAFAAAVQPYHRTMVIFRVRVPAAVVIRYR